MINQTDIEFLLYATDSVEEAIEHIREKAIKPFGLTLVTRLRRHMPWLGERSLSRQACRHRNILAVLRGGVTGAPPLLGGRTENWNAGRKDISCVRDAPNEILHSPRYAVLPVITVGSALGLTIVLKSLHWPHPFTFYFLAAIAVTFLVRWHWSGRFSR